MTGGRYSYVSNFPKVVIIRLVFRILIPHIESR